MLSLACAIEPLRAANLLNDQDLYRWTIVGASTETVRSSCGILISPDCRIGELKVDIFIVCAGETAVQLCDETLFAFLRKSQRAGVQIGALSSGAFLLARAGVLFNRRCTVHWESLPAFREEFPDIDVSETLFEFDRRCFTCAGGSATLDLMHTLIAQDDHLSNASGASDWLIHTNVRDGSDRQRMAINHRLNVAHPRLVKAIARLEELIDEPVDRKAIAAHAGISVRQMERLFAKYLDVPMSKYVTKLRIDRAKVLVKRTTLSLKEIAVASGFRNTSHFSAVYRRHLGHSPGQTRRMDHSRNKNPDISKDKALHL